MPGSAVQRRRLQREGERSVPHYWDHVLWVWGYDSLDEFIAFADQVNLDGVVKQITVPFLIAHGAGDRQIPLDYAHRSYDQAVASPQARTAHLHLRGGGYRAHRAGPPAPRQHVHRRLGGRHVRRAQPRPTLITSRGTRGTVRL